MEYTADGRSEEVGRVTTGQKEVKHKIALIFKVIRIRAESVEAKKLGERDGVPTGLGV